LFNFYRAAPDWLAQQPEVLLEEVQFVSHQPVTDLSGSVISLWQRGLAWMLERLDSFRPADSNNPDQLKEIAELSLFYGHVLPWVPEQYRGMLAPIGEFLREFFGKDLTLAHWARRVPSQYNPYILAYLPLRSIGVRLPAFEEAVSVLHSAGYPDALENTPYREMELQYLTWKAGFGRSRPNWGPLYRATAMRRGRNPIYFSIQDVYSVTHTLLYLTDFCGPRTDMPAAERQRAIEIVEPLLVHYWRKPDWDITCELLINLVALSHYETSLFTAAFNAVANVWRKDGALPGPHFSEKDCQSDPKLLFRDCYHTTLVGLILCAAYLYRSVWRGGAPGASA